MRKLAIFEHFLVGNLKTKVIFLTKTLANFKNFSYSIGPQDALCRPLRAERRPVASASQAAQGQVRERHGGQCRAGISIPYRVTQ